MQIFRISPRLNQLLSNQMVRGGLMSFVVKVMGSLASVLLSLSVARLMPINQAGYFFISLSLLIIVSSIARLGFDNALIRFIAAAQAVDEKEEQAGIYTLAIVLVTISCLLFSILGYVFSASIAQQVFNKPELDAPIKYLSICLLPYSMTQLNAYVFQAYKRPALSLFFQGCMVNSIAVIAIVLFFNTNALEGVKALLIGSVLGIISSALMIRTQNIGFAWLNRKRMSTVFLALWPMFNIKVMSLTITWSAALMLGAWAITEESAYFGVAQRLALLVGFVLVAFNTILAPRFAALHKTNQAAELELLVKKASNILFIIALPILLFIGFFSKQLLLIFSPEYQVGSTCLIILAIGQFVNLISGSVGYLLQMTGQEKVIRKNTIVSLIIVITGGIVFIPVFGAIGAAFVTAIGLIVKNLLGVYHVKKNMGFVMIAPYFFDRTSV